MTALNDFGADIIAYSRDRRLVMLGEVRNKKNTSPHWAAQLRRNILSHGRETPNSDYYFVATPDRLYLWKRPEGAAAPDAPPIAIEARAIFSPYFKRAGVPPEDASSPAFELVVAAWLSDIARSDEIRAKTGVEAPSLAESGFLEAIKDGQIAYDTAA
jgi:hypothetical protein